MRGSSRIVFGSAVPVYPTRTTSAPLEASARAWYCMRALLPRAASTRTTARLDVGVGCADDYSRTLGALLQSHCDHADHRPLFRTRRGPVDRSRVGLDGADGRTIQVRV